MQSHPTSKHPKCLTSPYTRKPFLKWVGGKQRLISSLLPFIPTGDRLIEPFVGAGSICLASNYPRYVINDANPDLMAVWTSLKHRPREFIERANVYFTPDYCSQTAFLKVRSEFNAEVERFERAVRFIYLNRMGFNGLYRVNKSGKLNTPYGYPKTMPGYPFRALEDAALQLHDYEVRCGGYMSAIDLAGVGDVLYCDPPYLSRNDRRSSIAYAPYEFGLPEFQALVIACERAYERGAKVVISQVDNEVARATLRGWTIESLTANASFAADARGRGTRNEIIALMC